MRESLILPVSAWQAPAESSLGSMSLLGLDNHSELLSVKWPLRATPFRELASPSVFNVCTCPLLQMRLASGFRDEDVSDQERVG